MKKLLFFLAILMLWLPLSNIVDAYVANPEYRGVPVKVTIVTQTAITSTPSEVPGSALNRVNAYIINSDENYNIRVTWASTTYTAAAQINGSVYTIVIPPGAPVPIPGPNYDPGPWTEDTTFYGKTMFWNVSPTPHNATGTFIGERRVTTPPD